MFSSSPTIGRDVSSLYNRAKVRSTGDKYCWDGSAGEMTGAFWAKFTFSSREIAN